MTTATEAVRPKQTESTQQIITTPKTEEEAAVREVERQLREQNQNGSLQEVRPVTAATPVAPSPDLAAIKAERVGSEEPSINSADVSHNVDILTSPLTGKSIWARIGKAFGWVNTLKRRVAQKKAAGKSYDPIDVG